MRSRFCLVVLLASAAALGAATFAVTDTNDSGAGSLRLTGCCGGGIHFPTGNTTRGQMAAFISRAFALS